jgi:hypothetical protein
MCRPIDLLGKRWGLRRLSLFPAESTTRAAIRYQHGRIHVPRFVRQTRYVPLGLSYDDVVEEINRFRPEVIYSYGSVTPLRYVAIEDDLSGASSGCNA